MKDNQQDYREYFEDKSWLSIYETGLPMNIFIIVKGWGDYDRPTLNVQRNYKAKWENNSFRVSISRSPKVVGRDQGEISDEDIELVFEFIRLNRKYLKKFWNTNFISDLIDGMRPVRTPPKKPEPKDTSDLESRKETTLFLEQAKSRISKIVAREGSQLFHIANQPINPKESFLYHQYPKSSPSGLWYAKNADWIDYHLEWKSIKAEYRQLYQLEINYEKILCIRSTEEFVQFYEKFHYRHLSKKTPFTSIIKWDEVAEKYNGIEIMPYIEWDKVPRHSWNWYEYWDIGSGCVWNSESMEIKRVF